MSLPVPLTAIAARSASEIFRRYATFDFGRIDSLNHRTTLFKLGVKAGVPPVQTLLDQRRIVWRYAYPLQDLTDRDGLQTRQDFNEEALPLLLYDVRQLAFRKLCLPLHGYLAGEGLRALPPCLYSRLEDRCMMMAQRIDTGES